VVPQRTESSVTSSDEDKVDIGTSTTSEGVQPSTSYRMSSPTPSSGPSQSAGQGSGEQPSHSSATPQHSHRVRPTPIVWDQPTSSSSMPQPIPQQQVPRSSLRGGRGGGRAVPPLMQIPPEPGSLIPHPLPVRGGFRPVRATQQQSARRSRPHGPRGIMRGGPRGPY
jgi:hypothetical protein